MEVSALNFRQRLARGTRGMATGAPVRRRQARLSLQLPSELVGIALRRAEGVSLPAREASVLRSSHALDFLSLRICAAKTLFAAIGPERQKCVVSCPA